MKFKGKVAVVFAASRGIGRAVAERLGHDGAAVAVNYASNRPRRTRWSPRSTRPEAKP
jgi:NAD(P)-dependent dehydrogenase (short-subunit alcohol dehydrogenase family)